MWAYAAITAMVTLLAHIGNVKGLRALWWVLPTGALILISGTRDGVGTDFNLYRGFFLAVDPTSLGNSLEVIPQEQGFVALMFVLRQITDEFQWLLVACALLTVLPIFVAIRLASPMPTYSVFLYLTLSYYLVSLNAVRQSIAVAFVFLAAVLFRRFRVTAVVCAMLAPFFHASAIIAILILILASFIRMKLTKVLLLSFVTGIVGAGLLQLDLARSVLESLNERYGDYLERGNGAGFGTVLVIGAHLAVSAFCVWHLRHAAPSSTEYRYTVYYLVSTPILMLATANEFVARLEPYFGIFAILSMPLALNAFPTGRRYAVVLAGPFLVFTRIGRSPSWRASASPSRPAS